MLFGYKKVAEKYRENHEAVSYVALLEKIEELKGLAKELNPTGGASEMKKRATAKKCLKLISEHGLGFHLVPTELYDQGEVGADQSRSFVSCVLSLVLFLSKKKMCRSGHPCCRTLICGTYSGRSSALSEMVS